MLVKTGQEYLVTKNIKPVQENKVGIKNQKACTMATIKGIKKCSWRMVQGSPSPNKEFSIFLMGTMVADEYSII